jgi:hypothetical protein
MNETSIPCIVKDALSLREHENIYKKLELFIQQNKVPHIIFHGGNGCGKKTILYSFLFRIYNNDVKKIRKNVLYVNCAHGKGIKFIREDIKFFAKTNVQVNENILFKSIVLFNAEYLTTDAQSALRRSIEQFSHTTRFFIVTVNKNKLLQPILSRFCEMYIPNPIINDKEVNLHVYHINNSMPQFVHTHQEWFQEQMNDLFEYEFNHDYLFNLASELYEKGFSCIDVVCWLENCIPLSPFKKCSLKLCFNTIRSEIRSEKLLILYILDYVFMRKNKDIKSITSL